jgi:hypothetical protein
MNNKKTYTTPELDIVRIAQASMIAASVNAFTYDPDSSDTQENTITNENSSTFEFNSNAFEGGLMDE